MSKFLLSLVAITAVATPALAQQPSNATPIAFERDGISYVGTVEQRGSVRLISGHEVQSGRPFELEVRNGRVTGTYGSSHVSYTVASK